MTKIESNIFLIENLHELNCAYRVYRLWGLSPDMDDYHKNSQYLVDQLSRKTKSACQLFREDGTCFIAQPVGADELPKDHEVVRQRVTIEKLDRERTLQFDSDKPLDRILILRFLQFSLQNPLFENPALWLPRTGAPFFHKAPDKEFRKLSNQVDLYKGFKFRVVSVDGKIGICVDTSNKYVSRKPLPTHIKRNDFEKHYKKINCIYEYGDYWSEIKIEGLNDLTSEQLIMPWGASLYDEVHKNSSARKSEHLLALPRDCSVLIYNNSMREVRNAPSGLCRMTFTTDQIGALHRKTIKHPEQRRAEIKYVVEKYLKGLKFGDKTILLTNKPYETEPKFIRIPKLLFGKGKTLTVGKPNKNGNISLAELSSKKKELLYSKDAGLYVKKDLDRQYFFLPKSVHETYGRAFIEDLKIQVNKLLENAEVESQYDPIIIPYDDSVQKNVYNMARAIFEAVDMYDIEPGFAVMMIPRIQSQHIKEDELANLVMREMRKKDVFVSIIHTTVPGNSYELDNSEGEQEWFIVEDGKQRGTIIGYLRGVALNKVLLLNSYWPFVLKSELNADLTIGIDVKNNVAGFTFIYKTGADIRFFSSSSDDLEQLSGRHIKARLSEYLSEEKQILERNSVANIVIHRQGRLFPGELKGVKKALESASKSGLLPKNYTCTYVEVQKTSSAPMRMFAVRNVPQEQRESVTNPSVGTYMKLSEDEAFLCNTGFPYKHFGTSMPIRVKIVEGHFDLDTILQDVFSLANLTWTKVDDCSRDPLSIKMTDIRLREVAGDYKEDSFKFAEDETGGDEDE
jgi:hypothetical protein